MKCLNCNGKMVPYHDTSVSVDLQCVLCGALAIKRVLKKYLENKLAKKYTA